MVTNKTMSSGSHTTLVNSRFQSRDLFLIEHETDRRFTYREFGALAMAAGDTLLSHGLKRGDRVGLMLSNSAEFAAYYFGCLIHGIVAVAINPSLHDDLVRYIAQHSRVALVVTSGRYRTRLPDGIAGFVVNSGGDREGGVDLEARSDGPARIAIDHGDDSMFTVTYTSGTSDRPKGVAHSLQSLLGNAESFNRLQRFDESDVFLNLFPMSYMAGFLNSLLGPFACGGTVVLVRPFDARSVLTFWKPIVKHNVTVFWIAPTMVASLTQVDRDSAGPAYASKRLKRICVGTAALTEHVRAEFEAKYGAKLYESYGLTELLILTANSPMENRPLSVGRLLDGVAIRIDGKERDDEADGEIEVATAFRMLGYISSESSLPEQPTQWFPTGDRGSVSGGFLRITGRSKDLIIKGGLNISPRSIEEVLVRHPQVASAAAIGLPHDFYGEEVVAVVALKDSVALADVREQIESLCRAELSETSVPGRFFQIDEMPLNSSGKVQKRDLIARFSGC